MTHRCVVQTRDGRLIGDCPVEPIDGYLPRAIIWKDRVFIVDSITTREITYYREVDAYFTSDILPGG